MKKDLGSMDFFSSVRGLEGDDLLQSLVGEQHQIGDPHVEDGESWNDIPVQTITDAHEEDGRIIVDVEDVK